MPKLSPWFEWPTKPVHVGQRVEIEHAVFSATNATSAGSKFGSTAEPVAAGPAPVPCCGEYATCLRPCTPRGRWLAEQESVPSATTTTSETPRTEEAFEEAKQFFTGDYWLMGAMEIMSRCARNLERELAHYKEAAEQLGKLCQEADLEITKLESHLSAIGAPTWADVAAEQHIHSNSVTLDKQRMDWLGFKEHGPLRMPNFCRFDVALGPKYEDRTYRNKQSGFQSISLREVIDEAMTPAPSDRTEADHG